MSTSFLHSFRTQNIRFGRQVNLGSYNVRHYTGSSSHRKALPFSLNNAKTVLHPESNEDGMLRMVMFGKPGAGKGTLADRLVKNFDIVSISTGDLLRQHIAQKTDIGRQAEEIVARGDLLPDEFMLQVLTSKLDYLHDKHWILDGFPRTIVQGELLDTHLRNTRTPLTLLVTLSVPEHILHARIANRFVHPGSGRVYNTNFNPPRVAGLDDVTGEPLVQRPDDTPEVYQRRLVAYERATAPLLGYYESSARTRGGIRVGSGQKESGKGTAATSASTAGPGSPATINPSSSHHHRRTRGLQILPLVGETSDEMWPTLERSIRELFPSVRANQETKSREAVAVLTAAATSTASSAKDNKDGNAEFRINGASADNKAN